MPIPALAGHGLLPPGIYPATLAEVTSSWFATGTARRKYLIEQFLDWREQFSRLGLPLDLFLDGKFFSDKSAPSDIDVVVDISKWNLAKLQSSAIAPFLDRVPVKAKWSLDVWPYHPVEMPFLTLDGTPVLIPEFFQRIKPEDAHARKLPPASRKGIVKLIP